MKLNIDLSSLAHFEGFVDEFTTKITGNISKRELTSAVHSIMADQFDKKTATWAKSHRALFHHVYEYNPVGDPYGFIGVRQRQLWVHTKTHAGGGAWMGNFRFLPATQPIPSYEQRRKSRTGTDPLRRIARADFDKLVDKANPERRYTFTWKAPMLEYDIPRRITPTTAQLLFLPAFSFVSKMKGAAGPGWRFTKSYVVSQQPPGPVAGAFTAQWIKYWSSISAEQFDRHVGKGIAKAVSDGMAGASKYKPVSHGTRKLKFVMPANVGAAREVGRKRARAAADMYNTRLRQMNMTSEWILGGNQDIYF